MRALLQRVSRAEVREADDVLGSIGEGLVVLLGVGAHDAPPTADALARKVVDLRMFADEAGKTHRRSRRHQSHCVRRRPHARHLASARVCVSNPMIH